MKTDAWADGLRLHIKHQTIGCITELVHESLKSLRHTYLIHGEGQGSGQVNTQQGTLTHFPCRPTEAQLKYGTQASHIMNFDVVKPNILQTNIT